MAMLSLILWGHWGAPNSYKVCIILEALKLPYETNILEFSEVKQDSYIKLNPNGRLPTLQDPNTGVTLFEVSSCTVLWQIGNGVLIHNSQVQSCSTSLISMTITKTSPTARSWRNTRHSNGLLSRSQVRENVICGIHELTRHRARAILRPSNLVCTLPSREASVGH